MLSLRCKEFDLAYIILNVIMWHLLNAYFSGLHGYQRSPGKSSVSSWKQWTRTVSSSIPIYSTFSTLDPNRYTALYSTQITNPLYINESSLCFLIMQNPYTNFSSNRKQPHFYWSKGEEKFLCGVYFYI